MSTAVAVNRPTEKLDFFQRDEIDENIPHSTNNDNVNLQQAQTSFDFDLEERLRKALKERDEEWRKHEKDQIAFLQTESSNMLKGLHHEIDRLGHHLRDAKRQLFVSGKTESLDTEKKIVEQEKKIRELEQIIEMKEEQAMKIERKVTHTVEKLQEQITLQADRIRQLSAELNDRNQSVAHLSSQLRSYRLRDAMATAQQRRRVSQNGTSPLTSPTSPQRMFPPKGLAAASVTVSYPGPNLMSSDFSNEGPGSIERPIRRRLSAGLPFGK